MFLKDESDPWHFIPHIQSAFAHIFTVQFGDAGILSFHGKGLAEAVLSLGHLVHRTLDHLIFSSWSTFRMIIFHHCQSLFVFFRKDKGYSDYIYTHSAVDLFTLSEYGWYVPIYLRVLMEYL